ncbi:histidinol-phosphate transaminase [Mangrovimonas sp. AS39]|nr:histidinol-phosphate transaminase [Mangrovimonas futianensis]MCF1191710.1 histidinol-phosphate transaminase [Mangrovimonas futianensis]MCF1195402.1 histidinol-phosphate transaminase [Mangrovimonas futianensis]
MTINEIKNLVRPSVMALKPYSSARDEFKEFDKDLIFLDANENPFSNGLNRYPDPQQTKLKERLSELKGVSVSNILLGNGSDEVLDLLIRAFCEPNQDEILILPPTYGMYQVLAEVNNVKLKAVNLSEEFQLRVENILNSVSEDTKILFICSPNNPSGNSLNSRDIESLLQQFKGLVVIDEAYIDFSSQASWLNRLQEFPNLVITQTLSKAYGLAGIRLGICYSSEFIISNLNKIKPPYNINELTQQKALEQLNSTEVFKTQVQQILTERNVLERELRNIAYISEIYPSDANFILVKVDDATKRYNQLIQKGIVVRNRSNQVLCENCLRITVGTTEENTNLILALKSIK